MRAFGSTDLKVSDFGLGCARIGGIFQNDTHGFIELLAAARGEGINFFDTADMYSQGESESLIGRAFRGARSKVVIATKAGYCLPARRKLVARIKPLLRPLIQRLRLRRGSLPAGAGGKITQDFSPAYLRRAVEGSLRRLRTDYVDLLQLHSPPLEIVERGEWQVALEDLKRAGKIRYYGISCDSIEVGMAALRYPGVSALQFLLNLLERRAVDVLLPKARAQGVACIARECLANGLLVKPVGQVDLSSYCATPEERRLREEQIAKYRKLAADAGKSLTQLALDYVRQLDGVSVTLLGARNREQLRGLLGTASSAESARV